MATEIVERLRKQADELDPPRRLPGRVPFITEVATAGTYREAADLIEELEQKHVAGESIEQALREATAQLAQCYRLTGADPDGDSDSMLAKFAVEEVGRLRKESDEAEGRVEELRDELEAAKCMVRRTQERIDKRDERVGETDTARNQWQSRALTLEKHLVWAVEWIKSCAEEPVEDEVEERAAYAAARAALSQSEEKD